MAWGQKTLRAHENDKFTIFLPNKIAASFRPQHNHIEREIKKKKKTMAKMLHSKCKNAAAKSIFGWNFESAINANRTLG